MEMRRSETISHRAPSAVKQQPESGDLAVANREKIKIPYLCILLFIIHIYKNTFR